MLVLPYVKWGSWIFKDACKGCWVYGYLFAGHRLLRSAASLANFSVSPQVANVWGFAWSPSPARVPSEAAFRGGILMRSSLGPTPLRRPSVCSPKRVPQDAQNV